MKSADLDRYRNRLLKEEVQLKQELSQLGVQNLSHPLGWEPRSRETEPEPDENDMAAAIEAYSERVAILSELSARYRFVYDALERFSRGTYGVCFVLEKNGMSHTIEKERLDADPAAHTCKQHVSSALD